MERNPDAVFWIALSLVLGVVLLAAALGPRDTEEVRLGNKPEGSTQGHRAVASFAGQADVAAPVPTETVPTDTAPTEPAPEDYSPQPAPTDTVPTDTVPTDTEPLPAQPATLEDSSAQPPPRVTSCPQDADRPSVICDKVPSEFSAQPATLEDSSGQPAP